MSLKNIFRVFEHQRLKIGDVDRASGAIFEKKHFEALEMYHGNSSAYFSLINKGVKFNQFVGVLQIGNLTIEVLPKADKGNEETEVWHAFLIDMLKQSGIIDVKTTGFSSLRTKSNSILEIYFQIFVNELRYLLHAGLIKKYRKTEGNLNSLKGSLLFPKHLAKNYIHAERFFVCYTTYDRNNFLNQILYKTIKHIKKINTSPLLNANIANLLIDFPECKDLSISDSTFEKIAYDRKSEDYKRALSMSRMILLNYFPDIRKGQNDVLALMFDMNKLWEKYVLKILNKKLAKGYTAKGQIQTNFWFPDKGNVMNIKPDILIVHDQTQKTIVALDTKWKNLTSDRPEDADIKQMLSYNLYNIINSADFVKRSALVYPTSKPRNVITGEFINKDHGTTSLVFIKLNQINSRIEPNFDQLLDFIKIEALAEKEELKIS